MQKTHFNTPIKEAQAKINDLDLPYIERTKYDDWPLIDQDAHYQTSEFIEETLQIDHLSAQIETNSAGQMIVRMSETLKNQGVIITTLEQASESFGKVYGQYFGSVVPTDADKLLAYNFGQLTHGLFIYIPRGVIVEKPIELKVNLTSNQALNQRQLIVAEPESSLNFIERFTSLEETKQSFTHVSEVVVLDNARINYNGLDGFSSGTTGYVKRYADVKNDGRIDWSVGMFNDGDVILDLDTYLNGRGSESDVAVVGVSSGAQQQIVDSKVVNRRHHSVGNILQHGVILDEARLTFNGIGLIENGAKNADAQQESRVLMLSDQARGDANPILLIEEFEVTAGHAASSGQVDEDQMYYLMSRGLAREVAEYLVVRGFLGPVLTKMPAKEIRKQCLTLMDSKLARNYDVLTEIGEANE